MPSPSNTRLRENRTASRRSIDAQTMARFWIEVYAALRCHPGRMPSRPGSLSAGLVHLCRSAAGPQQCGRLSCADWYDYGYLREARSWHRGSHSPVALQGQGRRCLIPAPVLLMLAGTAG